MNRPISVLSCWLWGLALLTGVFFSSCTGRGGHEGDADSVLYRPPFLALTDSIRQAPGGDTAGRAALYFRRGELLTRNNQHELAAEDYRRSWSLRPDETTALRYSSALSITGHTSGAIRALKEGLARFPHDEQFPRLLAELYIQSGDTRSALTVYDGMLAADSANFEAWYERGLLLERARDTMGAIAALKKAYHIEPVNTYALELAHLYAERGNNQALGLCDEVLRKDSGAELIDPLFIKGIYYSNTGQGAKAIVQFDSCIRRDWKFTDAYIEKGIILFKRKQVDTALQVFHMAVTISNTYPDAYFWVGRCLEAKGENEEAILYYRQTLALDRDFTEAADRIKKLN